MTLKHIEIQNQANSDTYRVLKVYSNSAEVWVQADYGTIGAAARDSLELHVPIYNCTGRKGVNRNNLITPCIIKSGVLG